MLVVNERVSIPETDIVWTATRASGAGGQNVNKVSSKVELRFDVTGTVALDETTKRKLLLLAGPSRTDGEGRVMILSQVTRDQRRNLEDARDKLAELIRAALVREKPRRKTKPSRASKERRIAGKKLVGVKKKLRKSGEE